MYQGGGHLVGALLDAGHLPAEKADRRPRPAAGGAGKIYNPQYGVWIKVKAAPMKWDDIDAYLLTCFDVTEYKKTPGRQGEETV